MKCATHLPGVTALLLATLQITTGGCSGSRPAVERFEDEKRRVDIHVGHSDGGIGTDDSDLQPADDLEPTNNPDGGLAVPCETPDEETDREPELHPAKQSPPAEIRAVWVTRWDYKDEKDVEKIMASIAGAGFNTVYFQVRGAADAYYRSTIEPWAAPLSGKLGKDPGWDPLAVAIENAHRLDLQLHAWINVCTAWKGKRPPGKSKPAHILRAHPEWRVAEKAGRPMSHGSGYVFVNPAIDGFARHMRAVVAEIASFYDVDGLHFDYARYPSRRASFDRIGMRQYKRARKHNPGLSRAEWQRHKLTKLIEALRREARKVKPHIVISAAVTGIYKDNWGWGEVTQGFVDFHQDSHGWARAGVVDVLVPMIYWRPTQPPGARADFLTLIEDFEPLSDHTDLIAGINVAAGNFGVLKKEIEIARAHAYAGVALFSWALLKERGWLSILAETVFAKDPSLAAR